MKLKLTGLTVLLIAGLFMTACAADLIGNSKSDNTSTFQKTGDNNQGEDGNNQGEDNKKPIVEPEKPIIEPKAYTGAGYAFNNLDHLPYHKYGNYTPNVFHNLTNPVLVSTKTEALELFGETYSVTYCNNTRAWVKSSSFQDIIGQYDENYFNNYSLLTLFLSTGASIDRHELESVVYERDILTVSFNYHPFGGFGVMSSWFAIIEIEKVPADTKIDIKMADRWKSIKWDYTRFEINPCYYMLTPIAEIIDGVFKVVHNVLWKYLGNGSDVVIPDGITTIEKDAFLDCTTIRSISIPASVINISDRAFSGCTDLVNITVASGNSVYRSEGNCVIRKSDNVLVLGCRTSAIPNNVTAIGKRAFHNAGNIVEITIPDSTTLIDDAAFYGCGGSVIIPDSVTHIGHEAFYRFNGSITVGNGLQEIGAYAFSYSSLTEITLTDGITRIGMLAFADCYNLRSISMPDSVTEMSGFRNGASLTHIKLPKGISSIPGSAFRHCTSLESIIIPVGVTAISWYAFEGCTSLKQVFYGGANESMWNAINISRDGNGNALLISTPRYYYSEIQPTEPGNYWYYDTDGVTPVIW
ncbi:MAG: leucine-rich repeat domain-containing protein [Treponema sp.]|nr:leucine-rich repeat domain-containing protein [Treponema sp.]